uniref:Uncharacterized protein n=1 Tax=Arundo donax TaxID=35708 RepID=A0A0A9BKM0_ARUDO
MTFQIKIIKYYENAFRDESSNIVNLSNCLYINGQS